MTGTEFFKDNEANRRKLFFSGLFTLAGAIFAALMLAINRHWPPKLLSTMGVIVVLLIAAGDWWKSIRDYDRISELALRPEAVEPETPLQVALEVAAVRIWRASTQSASVVFLMLLTIWLSNR